MNSYELADKAEQLKTGEYGYVDGWMDEAAHMLRQQAERIERKQELIREQTALLVKQNNRIAELEKVSKPVAWMDYLEHSNVYDLNVSGRGIPLYTTPQIKELSDEEIDEIASMCSVNESGQINTREFARAILKKASEK